MSCARTAVVLLTLTACSSPTYDKATPGSASTQDSSDDSGAPDEAEPPDCAEVDVRVTDLRTTLTGVPTVARIRWTTSTPMRSRVVVHGWQDEVRRTDLEATANTAHEHILTGLHQHAIYSIHVEVEDGDSTLCSATQELETGSLFSSLPALTVGVAHPPGKLGYTVVPIVSERGTYLTVIDNQGEYVWARVLWEHDPSAPEIIGPAPPSYLVFRSLVAPDGSGIMVNTQAARLTDPADVFTIDWTGEEIARVGIIGGHTDFVVLADGTIAMLGWTIRSFGGRSLLGDTIIVRTPDGDTRLLWDAFDVLDVDLSRAYSRDFLMSDGRPEDWSHVNSISYDADQDAFYVTITVNNGVARIDAQTGETTWVLSQDTDDFTARGERLIHAPHSVQTIDDGLLVFNRGNPTDSGACSRAAELRLDETARTVEEMWRWEGDSCRQVSFLGNSQRVADGNTMTSWSHLGLMDEVNEDGVPVWQVSLGLGAAFTYAHRVDTVPGAAR